MKKLFYLLLCSFLVLGITGCGEETKDKERTDNSSKSNVKEEVSIEKKTYYCEETDDDDITYTFYYENDELVKVELFSIYADVYQDVKEELTDSNYTGVEVSRVNGGVLVEVDLLNGGSTYLFDETFMYESESKDLSWKNVSEMAKNWSLTCKLK